jgi:hypothetical protein
MLCPTCEFHVSPSGTNRQGFYGDKCTPCKRKFTVHEWYGDLISKEFDSLIDSDGEFFGQYDLLYDPQRYRAASRTLRPSVSPRAYKTIRKLARLAHDEKAPMPSAKAMTLLSSCPELVEYMERITSVAPAK